jgi:hypothetical protein
MSAVANFMNSAGCMLKEPADIHEREPLMSVAMKIVSIPSASVAAYNIKEMLR